MRGVTVQRESLLGPPTAAKATDGQRAERAALRAHGENSAVAGTGIKGPDELRGCQRSV